MTFVDPGEPGDLIAELRAGDLVNKPCLIRVTGDGEWPAKGVELNDDGTVKFKASGPRPYLECDVAVLGMGGVEEHSSGVRISWMRVVPQLSDRRGQWVAARPKKQDDNSIILMAFDANGKAKAAELMPDVEALFAGATSDTTSSASEPYSEFSPEPF